MRRLPALPAMALALGAAAAVVVASIFIGASGLPPAAVIDGLLGRGDPVNVSIVWGNRIGRALLAALCGGALAAAGAVFQGLFRNPLADPFVMGVSGGAALGAVAALALGASSAFGATGAAFAGGLAAALLAWRLARTGDRTPVASLLLAGFAIGSFCSAVLSVVLLLKQGGWDDVIRWLFGSCDRPDAWRRVSAASLPVAAGLAVAMARSRELDVLQAGEEPARQLGVEVERSKAWLVAAGSVMTAAAVAACGIVGFVGLVAPHAMRRLAGPGHRLLVPLSAAAGAAAVGAADLVARSALSQGLPVGAVTALLGAPFFLVLLRERARAA